MSSHMCASCGFYGAGEALEEHRKVGFHQQVEVQILTDYYFFNCKQKNIFSLNKQFTDISWFLLFVLVLGGIGGQLRAAKSYPDHSEHKE